VYSFVKESYVTKDELEGYLHSSRFIISKMSQMEELYFL